MNINLLIDAYESEFIACDGVGELVRLFANVSENAFVIPKETVESLKPMEPDQSSLPPNNSSNNPNEKGKDKAANNNKNTPKEKAKELERLREEIDRFDFELSSATVPMQLRSEAAKAVLVPQSPSPTSQ